MKFKFDVECTPDEARAFIGLPNIAPMQERMMKDLENKMHENLKSLSPEEMVKTWMPATVQGWGEMQKMFWNQMNTAMPQKPAKGGSKPND
jgi:Family of unknown function (DUF6489)